MRFNRFGGVLALSLLVALLPPGGTFLDDDGNIHEGSIEAIAAAGVTKGCNPPVNDRYCPDDQVNRGQMAAFLERALDLAPTEVDRFSDDNGHIFEASINRLAAAGITKGCNPPVNDRFCPELAMTRGEMAAMLTRAFEFPPSGSDRFVDGGGHLFEAEIEALAAAGVTIGCNPPANDRFCPDRPVLRDQMASFLTRALDLTPIQPPPRPVVVNLVAREGWGADPADFARMHPHTVDRLTVHHAGSVAGDPGPSRYRLWQDWHMEGRGWPDIAYHVIVGKDGTVYEGRDPTFEGDTGTTYDTTGHFLVVLEGNFEVEKPSDAQFESLAAVLAWASGHYGAGPETIGDHGDYAATLCPGRYLEERIESGELRNRVEELLDKGGVTLQWP